MIKPKILVSSCLLGNNVRYDGQNTLDRWLTDQLGKHFELVPICPELLMGMGVPREPVNLILDQAGIVHMVSIKSKIDYTEKAHQVSEQIASEYAHQIFGMILQKKSPSCGVERVKLYNEKDEHMFNLKNSEKNRGLFAVHMMENFPMIPIIDSGRLYDNGEKENFLRQVMCYFRFKELDGSIKALQDFHARYKFVIMEHHQDAMRKLGKIAANSHNDAPELVYHNYASLLFSTLRKLPTVKARTNVFYHLIGFFKNELESSEKSIIHQMISDYNQGLVPYLVPKKMLEFLINKHQQYYLKNHYYLDQFPKELQIPR